MAMRPVEPQKPVDIARVALRTLTEMALPPTPENYAREYRRAAGYPERAPDEPHSDAMAAESAEMLLGIIETVGKTTSGLSVGIEQFDGDLKTMFKEVDEVGSERVRRLVEGLIASGLAMQNTVEASRSELDATREHLAEVRTELERTRAQVNVDPLTGSFNRRGMEEIVGREIARARRTKAPLSLAVLDIDHFKRVNDEHGHDVGDQALVHLATVVKSGLRETDMVCRFGGEEFVVVLPGSGIDGALFVLDRLRVMVEKTPLLIPAGKLLIRFSAGVAELSGEEDKGKILKRADEALYAAKRAARRADSRRCLKALPRHRPAFG
jgi:diguanylate cyclase